MDAIEQLEQDFREGDIDPNRLVELILALQRELQAANQRIAQLEGDFARFPQQVRRAFQACAQAFDDELAQDSGTRAGSAQEPRSAGGNGNGTQGKGTASAEAVEQMVTDLLLDDVPGANRGEAVESAAGMVAPAKKPAAGAKGRVPSPGTAPEKVTAPVKTRPKQADDEDSLPKVPTKYWVTLAVLALALGGTWLLSWVGGPDSPATLANKALLAPSPEDRAKAAGELATRTNELSLPLLRRVATESSDAGVLTTVFSGLSLAGDADSSQLFLAGMAHKDPAVRDAAYKGLVRVKNIPFDRRDEFKANDPEETRTEALSALKKQYGAGSSAIP